MIKLFNGENWEWHDQLMPGWYPSEEAYNEANSITSHKQEQVDISQEVTLEESEEYITQVKKKKSTKPYCESCNIYWFFTCGSWS